MPNARAATLTRSFQAERYGSTSIPAYEPSEKDFIRSERTRERVHAHMPRYEQ